MKWMSMYAFMASSTFQLILSRLIAVEFTAIVVLPISTGAGPGISRAQPGLITAMDSHALHLDPLRNLTGVIIWSKERETGRRAYVANRNPPV